MILKRCLFRDKSVLRNKTSVQPPQTDKSWSNSTSNYSSFCQAIFPLMSIPPLEWLFNKCREKNWNNIRRWFTGKNPHGMGAEACLCPWLSACTPEAGDRWVSMGTLGRKPGKERSAVPLPHCACLHPCCSSFPSQGINKQCLFFSMLGHRS